MSEEGAPAPEQPQGAPAQSYEVGYGKPPVATRFKKGASGNSKGRPKRRKPAQELQAVNFAAQPANELLMAEAYRPVVVREGDRVIELPAIQAVFRAMGVSAIKGNRHAQELFAKITTQVESADREARADFIQTMMALKVAGEHELERARARGEREPELVPHPDDIIIDFANLDIHVNGPRTKQEKELWDEALKQRDSLQSLLSEVAKELVELSPRMRKERREFLHQVQQAFDEINDNLPRRYRVKLADRSWQEGASQPGSQKLRSWPGE